MLVRHELPTADTVDVSAQLFIASRDRWRNDYLPHLRAHQMVEILKCQPSFCTLLELSLVRLSLPGRRT
ncbi:hypothetical protein [Comamonas sp. BIGb0124]|uniref:hypothetical protein n=1 Tax=Comamonas sp. BIGb0124 TaxID=2485130 RepID=UPI0011CD8918|nr:hypothetical protein [Comamonas sp. BIGb0124]